jgi:hypothetical protein
VGTSGQEHGPEYLMPERLFEGIPHNELLLAEVQTMNEIQRTLDEAAP